MIWEFTDEDRRAADHWIPIAAEMFGVHSALADLERIDPADCDDCDDCTRDGHANNGTATHRHGRLNLCAPCARLRVKVAVKRSAEEARA
jgi:hypothetical protein